MFDGNRMLCVLSVGEFSTQEELYSDFWMETFVLLVSGAIYQSECQSYSSQGFFFGEEETTRGDNP